MRNRVTMFGILAALLALASATAQAQEARTYVVRGVFYTAPATKILPQISDGASVLGGGVMGSAQFAEELKRLEAEGKISVKHRPVGSVRDGETLSLTAGTHIPVVVNGPAGKSEATGYLLNGGRLSVRVEERDGGAFYMMAVDTEMSEPFDGVVHLASVKTQVTLKKGETIIFTLGTSPDNTRQTFFALSAQPVEFKPVERRENLQ